MIAHFYVIAYDFEQAEKFKKKTGISSTYVASNHTLRRLDEPHNLILLEGWENRSDYNELQNTILYLNCICLVETSWENLRSGRFAHIDKVKHNGE